MGVDSVAPTSRRGYLSQDELEQFADIVVTDTAEADDRISQAEEIIDSYVGTQEKFIDYPIEGRAGAAASGASLTLQSNQQNTYDVDYFKWCEVEILGGTGAGQRRRINSSTLAGVLTLDSAWTTAIATDSFYRIIQLGKFPRVCDVTSYTEQTPSTFYKQIPEAVKRAVAAQVEYGINMGEKFFASDSSEKQSESLGDYSYTNAEGAVGTSRLIAPKAKMLLRGIKNRTGIIEV